jgi:starvation-inducible DNA-binding protein
MHAEAPDRHRKCHVSVDDAVHRKEGPDASGRRLAYVASEHSLDGREATVMSQPRQPGKCGATEPEAQPVLGQRGKEIQAFGTLVAYPLALSETAKNASVVALNQILADSVYLREMYKKCHWQVSGPTFYQLHLLFDKHFDEQNDLVDMIGERIQTLGGVTLVMPNDVARVTRIEAPPTGREQVPVQLSRLLEAHEVVLAECHAAARLASTNGDDGSADLLVTDVIRTNEKQVWFISEHLVDTPLVCAR